MTRTYDDLELHRARFADEDRAQDRLGLSHRADPATQDTDLYELYGDEECPGRVPRYARFFSVHVNKRGLLKFKPSEGLLGAGERGRSGARSFRFGLLVPTCEGSGTRPSTALVG